MDDGMRGLPELNALAAARRFGTLSATGPAGPTPGEWAVPNEGEQHGGQG